MAIAYTVNGNDFTSLGVYVTSSAGLVNALKRKEGSKYDWREYHGEVVDLSLPRFEARDITLECLLRASSSFDLLEKFGAFMELWDRAGLQRLTVTIHPEKPLIYDVYRIEEVRLEREQGAGIAYGTFTLKLREPEPLKRVLRHTCTNPELPCTITSQGEALLTAGWGDGVYDSTYGHTVSHRYAKAGIYYVTLSGADTVILDAGTVEVWRRL